MQETYVKKILKARVYDVATVVPLDTAENLSRRLKNHIWLKREDLQSVHSFKIRGAYNKMVQLSDADKRCGVIAASAGNHAQGVALSARKLGINAVIVMPTTTPNIKVTAVNRLGAEVILHGQVYDEACQYAQQLAKEQERIFIHPYDDEDVIAGQGTIAIELLQQCKVLPNVIFVPVGGGGLIAGIGSYIKYLHPKIKIIGVEPDDAPSMYYALEENYRVELEQVGIFVDGVAVRQVGKKTFALARYCVDEVILVSTDEVCAAVKDIFDDTRSIVEPAGALALAGLKKYIERETLQGQHLIAINSGANINFDRLRHVSERAEIGERREILLTVTIPERPGSFREFCETIGSHGISEFNYRFANAEQAHVFVGIKIHQEEFDKQTLIQSLKEKNYPVLDMSDNEMAKLHLRYMVGGKAPHLCNEKLYRFEFPEYPGALLRFLSAMGQDWNISLFHYRNHGAAYGRVLVGVQVEEYQKVSFDQFLQSLGYQYWEESQNPAYNLFL